MHSTKNIGRITGLFMLLQFVMGILINEILLGPLTFAADFLTSVSTHANQVIISILLGFVSGAIDIVVSVLLFQVFKKQSEQLALLFIAFSIVSFMIVAVDNTSIQTLLSVSREYIKAGGPATGYFQTAGTTAQATRLWTHLVIMLFSCLPLSVFYYLLFAAKLVPRFISIWGLIAAPMVLTAALLAIFEQPSPFWLYLPMGLNQLFLAVWLIVKGFRS